ncbi:MAG TPA: hypothetical protein VM571_14975 [Noviherbaspirillum sp.]|nr:hypothetical protein [Noviherbaspirillum sp.]
MNRPLDKNPFPNPQIHVHVKSGAAHLANTHKAVTVAVTVATVSTAQADERIGGDVKGSATAKKGLLRSIGERLTRPRVGRRESAKDKQSTKIADTGNVDDDEYQSPYRVEAKNTFESLNQDSSDQKRKEIEEALAKIHEPLQQYTVLFGAMKEAENDPSLSEDKKRALKNTLNEMMTDLVHRDKAGVRKGFRESAESSPVAASLEASQKVGALGEALRDIRFSVGARAKGGVDENLSPMVVAKAVLKNFGAAHAEEGLASVCSRLMPGLRNISAINTAAYALTMSDAVNFSIVRTGFKIAKDLKRDLMDKAKVLSKQHYIETATILFTASEQGWGRGKGIQLVNQIVDLKTAPPRMRAAAYTVIRNAVDLMPPTAWPQDKQSGRKDLLEDLDRQVFGAHGEIPPLTTKAERKEEEWRNMYAAGRAPTLPNRA